MYEQYKYFIPYLVIGIIIFLWVYYDAKYKAFKQYPLLWAVASLFIPLVLILYLLYRTPKN